MQDLDNLKEVEHHKQQELCKTRAAYRQGKKLTAVKVYSVVTESQHLFIYGVPKIGLRTELKSLCTKYGQLLYIHAVADYKTEIFTECYHVQYDRIQSARIAKRLIDNRSFYGSVLHVCYAPEYESIDETRAKFLQRSKDVLRRINSEDTFEMPKNVLNTKNKKRKHNVLSLSNETLADPMLVWLDVPEETDPTKPQNEVLQLNDSHIHQITNKVNGPELPKYDLKRRRKEKVPIIAVAPQPNLIPTQVIQSRDYKHNHVEKKIVFRNKK